MNAFISHAQWPEGTMGCDGDHSTDTHDSHESAHAVCDLLERKGFGGCGKVFPLKTWVTDGEKALVEIPPKGDEPGDLADFERDVVSAIQQHREWRARWKEAQVKTVEWAFDVIECQERLAAAKERGVR